MNGDRSNYTHIVPYIYHCKDLLLKTIFIIIFIIVFQKVDVKIKYSFIIKFKMRWIFIYHSELSVHTTVLFKNLIIM